MRPLDLLDLTIRSELRSRELSDSIFVAISNAARTGLDEGPFDTLGTDLVKTALIPLWAAPCVFFGFPGDVEMMHDGGWFGRCLLRCAEEIARAVVGGELYLRDPDSWMVLRDVDPITANCLVSWAELEGWARKKHGFTAFYEPLAIDDPQAAAIDGHVREQQGLSDGPKPPAREDAPAVAKPTRGDRTLYGIIRALARALAEARPAELMKDGRPFLGYDKPTGTAGIVGHLTKGEFTDLKTTALEDHIGCALRED